MLRLHNLIHHGGRALTQARSCEGGAFSLVLVFIDKSANALHFRLLRNKRKFPKRGLFIYCLGGGEAASLPTGTPWPQMKVPGGAGCCPGVTKPGLFFVYATAVNATWGEEPKQNPISH